jgi:hypothetical protein
MGGLPSREGLFKGLNWVPNQFHEPRKSFPASFLMSHTLSPAPLPCALPTHSHLVHSTLGLATYPIPRVLFSAGEGKRCWLLSRCTYV